MDIETVIPGHGFVCTKQELIDLKRCLLKLRREVKKCYDRKLTEKEARSEIDLGIYREWPHQERLTLDIHQLYQEFGAAVYG